MPDPLTIFLLFVIISLLLVQTLPDDVVFGITFAILLIMLVVAVAVTIINFAQDPVGFISGLIFHNPFVEFTKAMEENAVYLSNRTTSMIEGGL